MDGVLHEVEKKINDHNLGLLKKSYLVYGLTNFCKSTTKIKVGKKLSVSKVMRIFESSLIGHGHF